MVVKPQVVMLVNTNNALKVKVHQVDNKLLEVILNKTVTTKVAAKITIKVAIKINIRVKVIHKTIVVTTIKICK
jgi:hypothetical protein